MYKKELRKSIMADVEANKNSCLLRELHTLSALFRRMADEEAYFTMTEKELNQIRLIFTIIHMSNEGSVRRLRLVAEAVARREVVP